MGKLAFLLKVSKYYLLTRFHSLYFDRSRLRAWQQKKVQENVRRIMQTSRFYQDYYAGQSPLAWETFRQTNKELLLAHFNKLNTAGIDFKTAYVKALHTEVAHASPRLGQYTMGLSSGTSGQPNLFLVSEEERLLWAGAMLAKMQPGVLFARQKIAFFLRSTSHVDNALSSEWMHFKFFDLRTDTEQLIAALNQYHPTMVIAPPSLLRVLAQAKDEKKLSIQPHKLISAEEILEPLDKGYIEKQFNQMVHQLYLTSGRWLATTCKYGTLHLNEDMLVVQKDYLDKRKFIPVITDLYATAQPLIRYRVNDVLTERQTSCPCGSIYTALEQIDGRCDDIFYIQSARSGQLKPLFPDMIRRAVTANSNTILDYKVVQEDLHALQIQLRCRGGLRKKTKDNIQHSFNRLFQTLGASHPDITFGKYIAPNKGMKLRRIVRNFSVN